MKPDEHEHYGRELYRLNNRLGLDLSLTKPKTSPKAKLLEVCLKRLNQLRDRLDELHAQEQGDKFTPKTYYPGYTLEKMEAD